MEKIDYSNLNARLLRLFLTVYDEESVNRASEVLDINQSTVSYSLDRLRETFGDPLFIKNGRGILPTDRARVIAPRVRELLIEMEALVEKREYRPEEDTDKITIATNVSEMLSYCEAMYKEIRSHNPNAPVQFLNLGSRYNVENTMTNQIADIVISVRNTNVPSFVHSQPAIDFDMLCYFDPSRRGPVISFEEYCEAGHAVLDFGDSAKSLIDFMLEAEALTRKVMLRAPNILILSRLMAGTDLIATMPSNHRNQAFAKMDYCKPPLPTPIVHYHLYWHRRSEHSPRNRWIRDRILSVFKNHPPA